MYVTWNIYISNVITKFMFETIFNNMHIQSRKAETDICQQGPK